MEDIEKFQNLLKQLFLVDASDLDFGIYRVLNYKRKQIEDFINSNIIEHIESAFREHKNKISTDIDLEIEKAKKNILQNISEDAFTSEGDLKIEFKGIKAGKEYLELKKRKDTLNAIDNIKIQTYNDLYNFFSRYYDNGDFVPQYRYSIRGHRYAIPYNGEEVKLYWANADQYFVKTSEFLRNYVFRVDKYKIVFEVVSAEDNLNSNKSSKKRFFVLHDENPIEFLKDESSLVVRFQYKELNENNNGLKQDNINQVSCEEILEIIDRDLDKTEGKSLIEILCQMHEGEKPLLLHHISRFTARNTKDYFIHQNLKKFLLEQLDYFIKSEIISIDTIESKTFLDEHITRVKMVKEIGEKIIDFLSQIEDFQKKLWKKKKFVLKTEYVITTDMVPDEFCDEIIENEDQKREWEELGFDVPETKEELRVKRLPIDTKHFSEKFKEKLLEKLTEEKDLDDLLDGLLIKSENWHALNLLLEKYKEKVQTIYIDPPYNTGSDDFLYKDRYQHSSWLSMMENRLRLAKELIKEDGVIFVSIANNANNYKESYKLGLIMEDIFDKRFADLIWKRRDASGSYVITDITETHEYIFTYGKSKSSILKNILSPRKKKDYSQKDEKGIFKWHDLVIHQYTKEQRPNLFYGVIYNFIEDELDFEKEVNKVNPLREIVIYPSEDGKSVFTMTKQSMREVYERGVIKVIKEKENYKIKIKKYLQDERGIIIGDPLKSILNDDDMPWKIGGTGEATKELKDLLGTPFDTAKPTNLIKLLLYVSSLKIDIILDFFAGSGTTAHAVMKLNKEDGGKRKYILVEMANYFDTVIIPRIKKVCYSFNWKDGTPQDTDGISQFFKYQILEQYEDTLDNIELKENEQAQSLFKDDYLLKYFLDYETREEMSLLNIEHLKNPFSYKLKVNLEEVGRPQAVIVDIPETFNYLLGLKIKKIKVRYIRYNGTKYMFILGEKEQRKIAIVWREYNDSWNEEDFKKDKEFVIKELKPWNPHIVYINGQSVLTSKLDSYTVDVRYIEPEFKRLMER